MVFQIVNYFCVKFKSLLMTLVRIVCFVFVFGSYNAVIAQAHCGNKHHVLPLSSKAANERSDTIDVLNYNIYLDVTDFGNQTLKGICTIDFVVLQNSVSTISLDLLQLTVDSIKSAGMLLSYGYNDTLLIANLPATLLNSDTSSLTVFYHGSPQGDPSNWGGWYWQGNYSYNLGVGFGANPHNYGRVWHPCLDNFVERATYDFSILTSNSKTAYANGLKLSEQIVGTDSLLTKWRINSPIPTYLACVAVADYTHVVQNYNSSLTGNDIPVYLIARASDTNNMKASFANLHNTVSGFEENYGAYLWEKVGYHLVPFNSGAMEHATSIAYPQYAATGGLAYETLMAHELSHHWWGNLVTCSTAEDMWINEGMASYSERLFLEHQYGYDQYIDDIRVNHLDVLHHAHISDGGYYAISGVPHNITYGDHSYNKGADVAHTLRGYLGDSLFFIGLQSFLASNIYKDVDATDFMNHLNSINGIDVTDFFTNWIFNPGFPHFNIDSVNVTPNGSNYDVQVYVKQKLKAAPNYYSNVPLEITFKAADWTEQTESFVMSGQTMNFQFTLPFYPVLSFLNPNDKISQAVTAENDVITSTGIKNYSFPFLRLNVSSISDSTYLRMEHHWASPDGFKEPTNDFMYYISTDRYWRIDGIINGTINASPRFVFDARTSTSGNLDPELFSINGFHEDSLVLLYRASASKNWEVFDDFTFSTQGSATDGFARFDLGYLKFGEYTFGWKKSNVGINENNIKSDFEIYPNPTVGIVNIDLASLDGDQFTIQVFDMNGKRLIDLTTVSMQSFIDVSGLPKGNYVLSVLSGSRYVSSKTFVKE